MRTMYHTTHYDTWESIRMLGILPNKLPPSTLDAVGRDVGIYLESDLEAAYGWASSLAGWHLPLGDEPATVKFVVLRVQIPENRVLTIDPDVFYIDQEQPTAFIYPFRVPPEHIELVDTVEIEVG